MIIQKLNCLSIEIKYSSTDRGKKNMYNCTYMYLSTSLGSCHLHPLLVLAPYSYSSYLHCGILDGLLRYRFLLLLSFFIFLFCSPVRLLGTYYYL